MRAVFDRLAHSSIMRLNANSMDKLFDLMTMAVKYQVIHLSFKYESNKTWVWSWASFSVTVTMLSHSKKLETFYRKRKTKHSVFEMLEMFRAVLKTHTDNVWRIAIFVLQVCISCSECSIQHARARTRQFNKICWLIKLNIFCNVPLDLIKFPNIEFRF